MLTSRDYCREINGGCLFFIFFLIINDTCYISYGYWEKTLFMNIMGGYANVHVYIPNTCPCKLKTFEIKYLYNQSCHLFLARSLIVIIWLEEIDFGNSTTFVKPSFITMSKDTSMSISSLYYVLYA